MMDITGTGSFVILSTALAMSGGSKAAWPGAEAASVCCMSGDTFGLFVGRGVLR